jgi:error-prone DNA polymerase
MSPDYAELHCLSNFTFLRGASHPEELVARAHALGYAALALTDECSLAGAVRAHVAARDAGLELIVGSEFALEDGPRLVLLATDRAGYGRLSQCITTARRAADKGRYRLARAAFDDGMPGCLALWLPAAEPDPAEARWLAEHMPGRTWVAVESLASGRDRARHAHLETLARDLGVPLVAAGDVHMHERRRRVLQDTLTAIRLGCPLAEAGHALHPNGERHLRDRERLARIYPAAWLAETIAIAERCRFSLDSLRYEYPEELVPPGASPADHLRKLVDRGLAQRFTEGAGNLSKVRAQVEHELALIGELGYEPYFLTVHDIVRFARERGILCQGRGSAANSAVCFCLGITEVDPARMEMLFERFISRERNEPPDIDVDFEHQRREEVMQYVYAKYGRDRAALTATVIRYRGRSAVRDVGKALGLDLAQVDRIAKALAWWDGRKLMAERLREAGFDPDNPVMRRLIALVEELIGFPRHLSQHVGGFVISRGPLSRLVPIENAAMPERTLIQWDKDDLDAIGLLKVDCLALGMLSAIRRALELVSARRGRPFAMGDIPPEDPLVYDMIGRGDTVGVFQIESRAQMSMLPRVKPRTYYDLVIEVAIVRPGPIQGGMVHPYLRRRQGLEAVTYPSEAVRKVLERTLGVPIFQEQVMQLAIVAAGFTPGEADRLRRSMAAWRRKGGLEHFERRLIDGMRERGYTLQFAQQIFRQIQGFGEYGFPESHSASFALLVYVSSWLKCHEPAAFACALLNSQPMGFYAPAQLVQDARRHHVTVRPVDVVASAVDCTLEPVAVESAQGAAGHAGRSAAAQPALRLGLRMVKGLSGAAAERIVRARAERPFVDGTDLVRRARLDRGDIAALADADALSSLAGHRRQARWEVAAVEPDLPLFRQAALETGGLAVSGGPPRPLLDEPSFPRGRTLPLFDEPPVALPAPAEGEQVRADYATVGLTLRRHPLALLRPLLRRRRWRCAADLAKLRHGRPVRVAGIVTCRQRPGSASGVTFVTLEDETGTMNVIVWRDLAERQRKELLASSLLGVCGTLQREGEVIHVVATELVDETRCLGRLDIPSRDFH